MKESNTCPKCKSTDVIQIPTFKSTSNSNTIQLSKWGLYTAHYDRYICLGCGFIESYIQLEDAVWQKWIEEQRSKGTLDSDFV